MKLNVKNETSRLKTVVLGIADSNGPTPTLDETFDAKSYESVLTNDFPNETDLKSEMVEFESVLTKYNVEVLRPSLLENCNQVFSRDVGFVIDDQFFVSNITPEREAELAAYEIIKQQIGELNINYLPEDIYVEGGDVILYNDYIFVGTYNQPDFKNFKTGRTNIQFVNYLKERFPEKQVIGFDLKKNDTNPYEGILHLDCTFQPVGKDKAIIYKDGFLDENDFKFLVELFGKNNIFEVTKDEMYLMNPNVFSIAENIVVTENNFKRLNNHLKNEWGFTVESINYHNVSKMGGLFRCSTMPLIRE